MQTKNLRDGERVLNPVSSERLKSCNRLIIRSINVFMTTNEK
jgi:hypothetical protein